MRTFVSGESGLACALLLFSHLAVAAPFATTSVSTISPCPSFCGGGGGLFDFDQDGGEGFITSFSELSKRLCSLNRNSLISL